MKKYIVADSYKSLTFKGNPNFAYVFNRRYESPDGFRRDSFSSKEEALQRIHDPRTKIF